MHDHFPPNNINSLQFSHPDGPALGRLNVLTLLATLILTYVANPILVSKSQGEL